jgi:hypothetical protein
MLPIIDMPPAGIVLRVRARLLYASTNAIGEHACICRNRAGFVARAADYQRPHSPSIFCGWRYVGGCRLDRRTQTVNRLCDPDYLVGQIVDPLAE